MVIGGMAALAFRLEKAKRHENMRRPPQID